MIDDPKNNSQDPEDPENPVNPDEKAMKEAAERFFAMFTQKTTGKITLKDVMNFMRVINFNLGQIDKKLTIIATNQEVLARSVESLINAHDYLKKIEPLDDVNSKEH